MCSFDDIKISGGKCSGGGSTPTTPVSEPVSEPVAAPVAEPDAEPEAKQEPETTDPVPEDPVDPADATTTTDTGATTDVRSKFTFRRIFSVLVDLVQSSMSTAFPNSEVWHVCAGSQLRYLHGTCLH